jgi:hypothetical protein
LPSTLMQRSYTTELFIEPSLLPYVSTLWSNSLTGRNTNTKLWHIHTHIYIYIRWINWTYLLHAQKFHRRAHDDVYTVTLVLTSLHSVHTLPLLQEQSGLKPVVASTIITLLRGPDTVEFHVSQRL